MKIVEERHPGESWFMWKIGNATAIDSDSVRSIGLAWLFKEAGRWRFKPRITGNGALFYNALFFWRVSLPFGAFFHMRLSKTRLFQCGVGWTLNGRLTVTLRVQTDASAAKGVTGPNYGQATGFDYGPH